jgi:hypothetical protein
MTDGKTSNIVSSGVAHNRSQKRQSNEPLV